MVARIAAVLLLFISAASAHSFYPWECCSDRDCAPLPEEDVEELTEGFLIKSTGEFVDRSKARVAPDGQFHVCRYETSKQIICFFMPFKGV